MKKKIQKPLTLARDTIKKLSENDLATVAGGAPKTTNETIRCSNRPGSCLSCGPTFCP